MTEKRRKRSELGYPIKLEILSNFKHSEIEKKHNSLLNIHFDHSYKSLLSLYV